MKYLNRSLKDYTNAELLGILNKNGTVPCIELAAFCSEILRRIFNGEMEISKND